MSEFKNLERLAELAPEIGLEYNVRTERWGIAAFEIDCAWLYGGWHEKDAQDILIGRCRRLLGRPDDIEELIDAVIKARENA